MSVISFMIAVTEIVKAGSYYKHNFNRHPVLTDLIFDKYTRPIAFSGLCDDLVIQTQDLPELQSLLQA